MIPTGRVVIKLQGDRGTFRREWASELLFTGFRDKGTGGEAGLGEVRYLCVHGKSTVEGKACRLQERPQPSHRKWGNKKINCKLNMEGQ